MQFSRVDYDPETDCCVGFVLPVDENGLPINDSFQATSFSVIESICLRIIQLPSMLMYAWLSLIPECTSILSRCVGTNRFTAENVCLIWKYICMECEKHKIHGLSFGADGDSHLLKAMRVIDD